MKLRHLNVTRPLLLPRESVRQFAGQPGASSVSPPGSRAFFRPCSPGSPPVPSPGSPSVPPGSPRASPLGAHLSHPPGSLHASPGSPPVRVLGGASSHLLILPAPHLPVDRKSWLKLGPPASPSGNKDDRRDAACPGKSDGKVTAPLLTDLPPLRLSLTPAPFGSRGRRTLTPGFKKTMPSLMKKSHFFLFCNP